MYFYGAIRTSGTIDLTRQALILHDGLNSIMVSLYVACHDCIVSLHFDLYSL